MKSILKDIRGVKGWTFWRKVLLALALFATGVFIWSLVGLVLDTV